MNLTEGGDTTLTNPNRNRGWLKNGNRLGDLSTVRRCGAKTRRQTSSRAPSDEGAAQISSASGRRACSSQVVKARWEHSCPKSVAGGYPRKEPVTPASFAVAGNQPRQGLNQAAS
jgi:hypothetical protein